MSTALTVQQGRGIPLITFDDEKKALIKQTVAIGATDVELALFLHQCVRMGLDPLARQIYFQKRRTKNGDQMTILTGIDGYRLVADRTGQYAGNDDPVFDDETNPRKATVTVYKMIGGQRCAFSATARWEQYYPGDAQGFMWRKMPHLMLGKCAEALALRKAFPAELSGAYVKEEMDQAGEVIEGEELPPPAPQPKPVKQVAAAMEAPVYTGSQDMERKLADYLTAKEVPEPLWDRIGESLKGKPFRRTEIDQVILHHQMPF